MCVPHSEIINPRESPQYGNSGCKCAIWSVASPAASQQNKVTLGDIGIVEGMRRERAQGERTESSRKRYSCGAYFCDKVELT